MVISDFTTAACRKAGKATGLLLGRIVLLTPVGCGSEEPEAPPMPEKRLPPNPDQPR